MRYVLYAEETAEGQNGYFEISSAEYSPSGRDQLEAVARNTPRSFIAAEQTAEDIKKAICPERSAVNYDYPHLVPSFVYPAGSSDIQCCFGTCNGSWVSWNVIHGEVKYIYNHRDRASAEQMCSDVIKQFQQAGVIK